MKVLGGSLILLATIFTLGIDEIRYRRAVALTRELEDALTAMETSIRWHNEPLPQTILALQQGAQTGFIFRTIYESLESKIPLQELWINEFRSLEQRELAEILCRVSLTGDREHILTSLRRAVCELEQWREEKREERRDTQRIRGAAMLSGAGLLIILLL